MKKTKKIIWIICLISIVTISLGSCIILYHSFDNSPYTYTAIFAEYREYQIAKHMVIYSTFQLAGIIGLLILNICGVIKNRNNIEDMNINFYGITNIVVSLTGAIIDIFKYQDIYIPSPIPKFNDNIYMTVAILTICIMSIGSFVIKKITKRYKIFKIS